MKTTLLTLALMLSQASFATIANSNYESRHQNLITEAVRSNCLQMNTLEEVSSTKKTIRVDQGIIDAEYTTVLEGRVRIDQNMFDTYEVTVKTNYFDHYDHDAKDHGVYALKSVSCTLTTEN